MDSLKNLVLVTIYNCFYFFFVVCFATLGYYFARYLLKSVFPKWADRASTIKVQITDKVAEKKEEKANKKAIKNKSGETILTVDKKVEIE